MLGDSENFVPYAIVAAPFHATIVAAVEGVVTEAVLRLRAGGGATVATLEKRQTKTISHRHPKRPRVHVEG